ncbi:MAG: DJ-1/PfpI family protein [Candidatus Thermoplasmatota archaeon]|jgi:protease I|nr:DJ-1/PfpI family protein [Candidatus Thermoplasmatota archaeon]MCL5800415.1 DJ-1/PfpI family protein [Candidatus Thermoplasmatota archaeon]
MKKLGIMLDDGYHDLELWVPYYRLKEEGIDFDILAWDNRQYKGEFGVDPVSPTKLLSDSIGKYDLVFFPGARSPGNLMKNPGTSAIIKKMAAEGTRFATICHSPLLLGEAGLLRGNEVTGHPSIKSEVEKAGATFVDSPVVRTSDQVLSGRTHYDLDEFIPELMNFYRSL